MACKSSSDNAFATADLKTLLSRVKVEEAHEPLRQFNAVA